MVIGLDIDDTITDTFGVMFAYAEKFMIEDLKREINIKPSVDIADTGYVQALHNWNREDELKFFNKYYRNLIEETIPYHFAVETINKLKEEGNTIILITARFDTENVQVEEITKAWLKKYGIKYDKLIIDAQNKGDIAKENNIDVFVDDSIINCISVAKKGIKSYIMENRCNIECNHPDVKRVYSWPHLEQEIRKEIK
ncbi:MAG: hypothetical protein J6A36_06150 [Clostridia bacterium]|nr:hypothetical protein [Clostridia bacterium]